MTCKILPKTLTLICRVPLKSALSQPFMRFWPLCLDHLVVVTYNYMTSYTYNNIFYYDFPLLDFSPDIILSDRLGSKHQLTNSLCMTSLPSWLPSFSSFMTVFLLLLTSGVFCFSSPSSFFLLFFSSEHGWFARFGLCAAERLFRWVTSVATAAHTIL